jgi:excisionase family DNA binding protein
VERLSLARWEGVTGDDSYWVTTRQAAPILGVNRSRVGQLVDADRIRYETTSGGRRLFRRQQIEVIGNARLSRRLAAS